MRRFSKIAAVAMVGALALAGCGSNGGGSEGDSSASADSCKAAKGDGPKVGLAYDVGGRGDQSFNDSAYKGMEKAIDEVDATCTEAKAAPDENDTIREERLRTLAEGGFNPVIAIGFIYSPAAAKVAAEYPDTNFAVIDGYSTTIPKKPLKNLSDLVFAEEQGSYLVGVAAALKSQAKHIGFVGGTHGDLIKKFEAGYTAGAKSIDPTSRSTSSTSPRTPTTARPASRTPPVARTRRRPSSTRAPTWSTTRPASPASVSSTPCRRPARASGRSVWTPTSTSPSTRRRRSTS